MKRGKESVTFRIGLSYSFKSALIGFYRTNKRLPLGYFVISLNVSVCLSGRWHLILLDYISNPSAPASKRCCVHVTSKRRRFNVVQVVSRTSEPHKLFKDDDGLRFFRFSPSIYDNGTLGKWTLRKRPVSPLSVSTFEREREREREREVRQTWKFGWKPTKSKCLSADSMYLDNEATNDFLTHTHTHAHTHMKEAY